MSLSLAAQRIGAAMESHETPERLGHVEAAIEQLKKARKELLDRLLEEPIGQTTLWASLPTPSNGLTHTVDDEGVVQTAADEEPMLTPAQRVLIAIRTGHDTVKQIAEATGLTRAQARDEARALALVAGTGVLHVGRDTYRIQLEEEVGGLDKTTSTDPTVRYGDPDDFAFDPTTLPDEAELDAAEQPEEVF